MSLQVGKDAMIDLRTDQRIIKQGGADAHGRGTGDQEFQGIFRCCDSSLSDDRDCVRPGYLIDLVDLQQGNRFDGGAGQSALIISDNRCPVFDIDGHAHQCVDDREGIGTRIDTATGIFGNVGLIGLQLGNQGLAGDGTAGLYHSCRHIRIIAKGDATFLDIWAGNVDLDAVNGRIFETSGDFDIFLEG